jgi:hypothetical protein
MDPGRNGRLNSPHSSRRNSDASSAPVSVADVSYNTDRGKQLRLNEVSLLTACFAQNDNKNPIISSPADSDTITPCVTVFRMTPYTITPHVDSVPDDSVYDNSVCDSVPDDSVYDNSVCDSVPDYSVYDNSACETVSG